MPRDTAAPFIPDPFYVVEVRTDEAYSPEGPAFRTKSDVFEVLGEFLFTDRINPLNGLTVIECPSDMPRQDVTEDMVRAFLRKVIVEDEHSATEIVDITVAGVNVRDLARDFEDGVEADSRSWAEHIATERRALQTV
jgi:hypothetical protein